MSRSARLLAAVDATWPAAETVAQEGWLLRRGAGGGKRVSAASLAAAPTDATLPDPGLAAAAMAAWGQPALFRIAAGEAALDAMLDAAGYALIDPVVFYAAPVSALADGADETARITRVSIPLALVDEIWERGGIGAGRRAVMARALGPKITLMARIENRPAGVAFVACDGPVAMVHAVEMLADRRRRGGGAMLMVGGANWAAEQGAETLAVAVTEANAPARALYEKLGMAVAGRYHYRIRTD